MSEIFSLYLKWGRMSSFVSIFETRGAIGREHLCLLETHELAVTINKQSRRQPGPDANLAAAARRRTSPGALCEPVAISTSFAGTATTISPSTLT